MSSDVLAMCAGLPEIVVAKGECLIEESIRTDRLYVLKSGVFEVVRDGVRVVAIDEPGLLPRRDLRSARSAAHRQRRRAGGQRRPRDRRRVGLGQDPAGDHVCDRAADGATAAAVTAYLVDIKRQYADTNTHLALMDQVLGHLIAMQPSAVEPGSERDDVPDY